MILRLRMGGDIVAPVDSMIDVISSVVNEVEITAFVERYNLAGVTTTALPLGDFVGVDGSGSAVCFNVGTLESSMVRHSGRSLWAAVSVCSNGGLSGTLLNKRDDIDFVNIRTPPRLEGFESWFDSEAIFGLGFYCQTACKDKKPYTFNGWLLQHGTIAGLRFTESKGSGNWHSARAGRKRLVCKLF